MVTMSADYTKIRQATVAGLRTIEDFGGCCGRTPRLNRFRSVRQGHALDEPHADLPGSDTELSVRERWIDQAHPVAVGGLRGHVPARPGCATPRIRFLFVAPPVWIGLPPDPTSRWTPLPFSSPSAPRLPGTRTCPSLLLCHAWHTRPKLSGAPLCGASAPAPGWAALGS
jgi:hypothetical protein